MSHSDDIYINETFSFCIFYMLRLILIKIKSNVCYIG